MIKYNTMKSVKDGNRIEIIDEIRGFAVICMVIYHALFIIGDMFYIEGAKKVFDFFTPVEPFFAGIFIFVCGISCTFSKNNIKRGLIIFSVGMGFTVATCIIMPKIGFEELGIKFGILHFLGVSVLIYSLLKKSKISINPYIGLILCAIFYAFFSGINEGNLGYGELITLHIPDKLYETNYLMPLGIYSDSFTSGDYFPIFPDIFIFLAGALSGKIFLARGYSDFAKNKHIHFFSAVGKKALIIYVIHMPIIYFIGYLINHFFQ